MNKARILIVEDQLILAEDLAILLEESGYEVIGITDTGEEAVKKALQDSPDLVMVDIQLRGAMDGIEAAQVMRTRLDPAIVYLTAHSDKRLFERAKQTEPDGYLYKPVSPIELTRTVEIVLFKKEMERKLRQSEAKCRELVETVSDGIVQTDPFGTVTFANPAYCRMLGFTMEQMIGKSILDFLPSESEREEMRAYLDYVARQQPPLNPWFGTHQTNDGALIVVQSDWNYRRDERGHVIGFIAVVKDITQRKKAEEELRESEEKYRLLFSHEKDAILLSDAETMNILDVNEAAEKLWGGSREELLRLKIPNLSAEPEKTEKALAGVMQLGGYEVSERRLKKRDGAEFVAEVSVEPFTLKGRLVVCSIVRDVTERKRAEESAEIEKRRFEALSDNSPFGLAMIDGDGTFRYINPKFQEMFGYGLKDVPNGKEWFRKAYPESEYRHQVIAEWLEDISNSSLGESRPRVFTVTCKNGQKKIVHFRPVQLQTGEHLMTCEDITERWQAEEKLRQSEEEFRRIIENLQDPFYRADMNGTFTFLSPASERVAGYKPEEGVGRPITMFYADPAERQEFMKLMMENGFVNDSEAKLVHKDGHTVWVSTSARLYKDKDGKIAGVEGIARDISDRKRMEKALRDREELIRSISDNLPSGMIYQVIRKPDGTRNFTYLSQAVREFYGCSLEEAMSDPNLIYGRIFPEDRYRVYCEEEKANEAVSDFQSEVRMINPSGDIRWSYFASSPNTLDDGSTSWSGLEIDITERKQAEDALRKSENLYRSVIENIEDVFYRSDAEGRLLMASPSGARLFGYDSVDEMIGLPLESLWVDPQERQRLLDIVREQGKVTDYEVVLKREDGSTFVASLSNHFYRDEAGTILGTEGIVRDISERKRIEAQLLQSQKLQAIGTLAGGVAHEINNLMQVVLGHADMLLLRQGMDETSERPLEAIRRAARSGADLVKRILAFSRKVEPAMRPLNLTDEVLRIEDLLRRTIPRMISLEMSLEDNLPKISADPSQIEQVLLNLAINAKHAMPEGGRLVFETRNATIVDEYSRTYPEVKPGKYVLLSVSDTGQGMEKGISDRIFEPFFTTKEPGEGTGLGLSVVFGIVQSHGGHIACYSEPGVGSTFKIFFPILADDLRPDLATTIEMPAGGTETLLLVDDEETVRTLASEMLELAGYTVLTAANGREALEVYRNHLSSIALVILDLVMPEMSGRKCIEELLKMNPNAKVLIASGYAANGAAKEARQSGAAGFVSKPFDLKHILLAIRKCLDGV